METPKQMGAGQTDDVPQRQQGDGSARTVQQGAQAVRPERDDTRPTVTRFNDWASI